MQCEYPAEQQPNCRVGTQGQLHTPQAETRDKESTCSAHKALVRAAVATAAVVAAAAVTVVAAIVVVRFGQQSERNRPGPMDMLLLW
jgi:hypothetical protein